MSDRTTAGGLDRGPPVLRGGSITKTNGKPSVGLRTVGCKLNQYETEGIAELLEDAGYVIVPFAAKADVYVVNTCTVTRRSDYRCRQMLRRAARTNPRALIVATGCYAQRDPDALAAMPEVGLVVGQSSKDTLPSLVGRARGRPHAGGPLVRVEPHSRNAFRPFDIERFRGYTRAFLKIQDGCDRSCAYCAVPGARGPSRSRPATDVVEQARRLIANGYRELVLTGVHIGSYEDRERGLRLAGLIEALTGLDGMSRLRLGSIEPMELTSELAQAVVSNDRVAPHLHVPLQSGSDRILSAMRRGYTAADYVEAVERVTDGTIDCGLGADVIVGFPGETDSDFEETVSLIGSLPVTYLHVFSFSPRPGTAAAEMRDDVLGPEKKRRSRLLRALGGEKSRSFRTGLIGSTQDVLLEQRRGRRRGKLSGLSGNYVRVEVEGGSGLCNRVLQVRIEGADDSRTWGAVLGESGLS